MFVISDGKKKCKHVFSDTGQLFHTLGSAGPEGHLSEIFFEPHGMATNKDGILFVADGGGNNIVLFHPNCTSPIVLCEGMLHKPSVILVHGHYILGVEWNGESVYIQSLRV